MADTPPRPKPSDLVREARGLQGKPETAGYKPAVPPTYPGRLGFGKVLVPPKPTPLLTAHPIRDEPTIVTKGVPPPAPLSAPQPPRSYSPPPMASPQEEQAIEREAESRGERVVRPQKPAPVETVVVHEYKVDPGTRAWLRGLVVALLGSFGVGIYGAVKPAPEAPPVVPIACEVMCPDGKLQAADAKLSPPEYHAKIHCCEIVTALTKAEAALSEATKARELAGKASDKATLLEQKTPTVNP